MARLERSLGALRIAMPMSPAALGVVMRETIRRNRVENGLVYLQITRGVARRDHAFPPAGTAPAIVVTARTLDGAGNAAMAEQGVAVVTVPDNRWGRVDIKSVALLPNVLAKQAAREQGAREAWFVGSGRQRDRGSSSNAWIVTADGKVVTRAADTAILRGITRDVLMGAIAAQGLSFEERPFTVAEALAAREAFLTSATQIVMPIVRIDGKAGRRRQAGAGRAGLAAGLSTAMPNGAKNPISGRICLFSPNLCLRRSAGCPVIPRSRPP